MDDTWIPDAEEVSVAFMPSGRRGRFPKGTRVLDAARALGVYVESACGGRAICGRCQIEVADGIFDKLQIVSKSDNVTSASQVEWAFQQDFGLGEGRRLGCQAQLLSDVVINVPADSQMHRQIVRKRAESRRLPLDPAVRILQLDVVEPDMHRPSGDLERVKTALMEQHGIAGVCCAYSVLPGLQRALRDGEWSITAAIYDDGAIPAQIIAVWSGVRRKVFGLAIDLGSTTIAGHLIDLRRGRVLASAGIMNPQIRFGEDLMSRVSYVMMNPGSAADITVTVREALDALASDLARQVDATKFDILDVVVVCNPIMHHFLLGIDPCELGSAPFALASGSAQNLNAKDVGLVLHEQARIHTLPLIAGHVGADAAAAILAEKPYLSEEMTLIVDIGTNAEIILGNSNRLLACSSPTGPAFEGAELSSGQRAAPGAIERVRIDRATLVPKYKIIGCDLWSDEPGFEEAVAVTGVIGICGSGIIEALAEMMLCGIIDRDGGFSRIPSQASSHIQRDGRTNAYVIRSGPPDILITQNDVRAVQLAKAALQAGARLLMTKLGVTSVDRIKLAGAFGSHIDPIYALVLGLVPDCCPERIEAVGNAAGTGARMALQDRKARQEIEDVVGWIEKIETAIEPNFQNEFVAALAIPHRDDPYLSLATHVELPPQPVQPRTRLRGARRRVQVTA
ncbi:MAG: ASKHA domain-containing protein [Hyphomicrobiaceae bacterium]